MKTQDFNFSLPPELIAQFPITQRAGSRMLCLDGKKGALQDAMFVDLPKYMQPGDVIIFNDTRVIKARLFGTKESGGKLEIMVERILDEHCVLAMIRASHPPKDGSTFKLSGVIPVTVLGRENDFYILSFDHKNTVTELLDRYGNLPLPPYIPREVTQEDEVRYQTIYAKEKGAVAAPTAGLHFDEPMLLKLREMGIIIAYVTLHVGAGTFQPVKVDHINDHKMHKEIYYVPEKTVEDIRLAKSLGGRVLAVGTTSLRALEAAAKAGNGKLIPGHGDTDIFITPGYRLNVVDRLLTNFHFPCSTLMMLVSAFGGSENICQAYQHAIDKSYRFLSYGDAMLIEKQI
ncbi:MAG: tRNA preQ1(34) S-adenosylmethionine ribosyltransferase-isomerase QueA [Nitrosomonadaceae bacterium]|jgi:S-adenosylmethionine:tRNA ribosyltransferase-isomerase|nr:tRNA preQ1(34) S-adenosylmethionine ribosyltransferase-isomerase QueA [Nitrosomonadaceae bacterium]